MGYSTDYEGGFNIVPPLNDEDRTFLTKLATTRRMKRNLGPEFGVDGEFFVDGEGFASQKRDDSIVDYNRPPATQPGLWLQWIPSEDGTFLQWDGNEKAYYMIEWLKYLVDNIFAPRGYVLSGESDWQGEDVEDRGRIVVRDNRVFVQS